MTRRVWGLVVGLVYWASVVWAQDVPRSAEFVVGPYVVEAHYPDAGPVQLNQNRVALFLSAVTLLQTAHLPYDATLASLVADALVATPDSPFDEYSTVRISGPKGRLAQLVLSRNTATVVVRIKSGQTPEASLTVHWSAEALAFASPFPPKTYAVSDLVLSPHYAYLERCQRDYLFWNHAVELSDRNQLLSPSPGVNAFVGLQTTPDFVAYAADVYRRFAVRDGVVLSAVEQDCLHDMVVWETRRL